MNVADLIHTRDFANSNLASSVIESSDRFLDSSSSRKFKISSLRNYHDTFREALVVIEDSMRQVEAKLELELHSSDKSIDVMLQHVARLGGKRLRPALLLLSAKACETQACGGITDEAIRLAVVVELVHTATLVHDDVLDSALIRRHQPTLHTRWDIPSSILIGDWLFTHAYRLANEGASTLPGRWIADSAKQVCCGEIVQGQSAGNFCFSESEYFEMLASKTGALCAVSCALGAWSSGATPETCQHFSDFGAKLGTAFQVYDDWLDMWGNDFEAGKTLGTDLEQCKPTLPIIHAIGSLGEEGLDRVRELRLLKPGELRQGLRDLLGRCDAEHYTLSTAKRLINEACHELECLPSCAALTALITLAEAAINRNG